MNTAFTRITSTNPPVLSKRAQLEGGALTFKAAANMTEGRAERLTVDSATAFAEVLKGLTHDQALCFGSTDKSHILSKAQYTKRGNPPDATTRSKQHFAWPEGAGVMMLDYDPQDEPLSRDALLEALTDVLPELASSAYVWWVSSSSNIFNGKQLTGVRGQRVYVLVRDAADIPRAGKVLAERLWLKGHGYYAVSRAGTALARTLLDDSVWQTNRLDFAAGAQCVAPLEQRRGNPVVHEGDPLDTRAALPDLTADERKALAAAKKKAHKAVEADVRRARTTYISEHPECERETIAAAVDSNVLGPDFKVFLAEGTTVTVAELLDDSAKYHGAETLDPLEPEYGNHRQVGKLYLSGARKKLYSQAHGGRTFRLIRQRARIQVVPEQLHEAVDATLDVMRDSSDFFDKGSELVYIADGREQRLNSITLPQYLGPSVGYWRMTKGGEARPIPEPDKLIKRVVGLSDARKLKPLDAMITAPLIDVEGRVMKRRGYDAATRLYLNMDADPLPVPAKPTAAQIKSALATVMEPFQEFRTASELDRTALAAAVLTAVERPAMDIAPAIGIDAPAAGTGKTYLATCLGALAEGRIPVTRPPIGHGSSDEMRKRLFAFMLDEPRVLLFDNVVGRLNSPELAQLLTSPTLGERVLGESRSATVPNRALFLMTGNNMDVAGDLSRRVLKCRLDAHMENPTQRQFSGRPLEHILMNRQRLVCAALTLIRGALQSDMKRSQLNTFNAWGRLVRDTLLWLDMGDVEENIKNAIATDPEKDQLLSLLHGIRRAMGAVKFAANELLKRIRDLQGSMDADDDELGNELMDQFKDLTHNRVSARSVGMVLNYRQGRIADGLMIQKTRDASRNTNVFQIVEV